MKLLWDLFASFFRVGLFTFGGGYAMLPLLNKEAVQKHGWADEKEILDYYAVAQCTPGIIASNTAAMVGCKVKGIAGAVTAVLGVTLPSLLIIMIIAAFIQNFLQYEIVLNALAGVQVAVAALIVNIVIGMWKTGIKDALTLILFLAAAASVLVFDVSPILIVLSSAAAGIAAGLIRERRTQ